MPWVKVRAPVRILDAGGWTDTWFSARGTVCHLSAGPGAEVFARMTPGRASTQVALHVPDFEDRYAFEAATPPGRHPLLEAVLRRWAPPGCHLEVGVSSAVPPGSSLGTSAAVVVALIAALRALDGTVGAPSSLARDAHDTETMDLGRQSGVQDQVAAAFGGANLVDVGPYPQFRVRPLELGPATWDALTRRVVTVYLGAHDSSAVHRSVIEGGPADEALEPLRVAAADAADALLAGDLSAYGRAMMANTEAQSALHPGLVNPTARQVIEMAAGAGAVGWKVNGAGGPGGTVSIIGPEDPSELLERLRGLTVLDLGPQRQGAEVVDGS